MPMPISSGFCSPSSFAFSPDPSPHGDQNVEFFSCPYVDPAHLTSDVCRQVLEKVFQPSTDAPVSLPSGTETQEPETDKRRVQFADTSRLGGQLADVLEVQCLKRVLLPELWPTYDTPAESQGQKQEWRLDSLPGVGMAGLTAQELHAVMSHPDSDNELDEALWCANVLAKLQSGHVRNQLAAFMQLRGAALLLASSPNVCSVLQRAFEMARCGTEQTMLAAELQGHVLELSASSHGSDVLQTCLEVVHPSASDFIAVELIGAAPSVARHAEGYRVLCRILEHLTHARTAPLIDELMHEAALLCRHPRANHVMQHALQYGSPSQQLHICKLVSEDFGNFARHRIATHVVEKALLDITNSDAQMLIVTAALQNPDKLLDLANNRQSQFVVRRLARLSGPKGAEVRSVLAINMERLRLSKYGNRTADAVTASGGA